jgi:hypothetical protein
MPLAHTEQMTHLDDDLLRQVQALAPKIERAAGRSVTGRLAAVDRRALVAGRLAVGLAGLLVLTPILIAFRLARRA